MRRLDCIRRNSANRLAVSLLDPFCFRSCFGNVYFDYLMQYRLSRFSVPHFSAILTILDDITASLRRVQVSRSHPFLQDAIAQIKLYKEACALAQNWLPMQLKFLRVWNFLFLKLTLSSNGTIIRLWSGCILLKLQPHV